MIKAFVFLTYFIFIFNMRRFLHPLEVERFRRLMISEGHLLSIRIRCNGFVKNTSDPCGYVVKNALLQYFKPLCWIIDKKCQV